MGICGSSSAAAACGPFIDPKLARLGLGVLSGHPSRLAKRILKAQIPAFLKKWKKLHEADPAEVVADILLKMYDEDKDNLLSPYELQNVMDEFMEVVDVFVPNHVLQFTTVEERETAVYEILASMLSQPAVESLALTPGIDREAIRTWVGSYLVWDEAWMQPLRFEPRRTDSDNRADAADTASPSGEISSLKDDEGCAALKESPSDGASAAEDFASTADPAPPALSSTLSGSFPAHLASPIAPMTPITKPLTA